jgi:chromosome segregation ATPase
MAFVFQADDTQVWATACGGCALPNSDQPITGLLGAVETLVDTAKRLQELEDHYRANESAFAHMQEQFRQMQEASGHLQSLTEERLASLSALSVEMKVRHSQGEQVLGEIKATREELKNQQAKVEQSLGATDARLQVDADRSSQIGQTLEVLRALVEQVQGRQSQLEQSFVAIEALARDSQRSERDPSRDDLQHLAEQTTERQARIERALSALQEARQGEKGMVAHLEKSLNTVRSAVVDLEKRQSQMELSVAAVKANGSDAAVINQSVDTVRALLQDLAERQSALQTRVDHAEETALRAAETSTQAAHQNGTQLSADHPAIAAAVDQTRQDLSEDFQQLIEQCHADYQSVLQQYQAAFADLPQQAHAEMQHFLDGRRAQVEGSWQEWLREQEERIKRAEQGCTAAEQAARSARPKWTENVEAASATHTSELRFIKTLMWVTLAAVGLAYALVAYAVILKQ